MHFTMVGIE